MSAFAETCCRCGKVIGPRVPFVSVNRHVERFERGALTVLDVEMVRVWCMDCDAQGAWEVYEAAELDACSHQ